MLPLSVTRFNGSLRDALRDPVEQLEFYWLGQSGFLFRTENLAWMIDAYLSDQLATKYRDHTFSHERLEPPPIVPDDLPRLDYVFCTHIHGDHFDRPTLESIGKSQPAVRFILPAGIENDVAEIDRNRLVWAEADQPFSLTGGISVIPLKAAHESFAYDPLGRHRFLGYVFRSGDFALYHSGDCVPYPGLVERLRELRPDLALLPVNGRRIELSKENIAGNFSLGEAIELCLQAGIPAMLAQHFGLFAFNTIQPELIDQAAIKYSGQLQILRAEPNTRYTLPIRA
jgi:L-ascorbate metabolism protein UlaG (beta-lactamase superfamily)